MDPDEPATTSTCIPARQLKDRWLTAFVFIPIMGTPSFSGRGGGGGGGGQDRARGRHLTAANTLSAYGRFNQWGGGGGGVLSAFGRFNQ